jgi:glycine hydroxymethyltransferase
MTGAVTDILSSPTARHLSDGYVLFDNDDVQRKVQGPVVVEDVGLDCRDDTATLEAARAFRRGIPETSNGLPAGAEALSLYQGGHNDLFCLTKPYFVGQAALAPAYYRSDKKDFVWREPADAPLRRTPLYETHQKLTRKIIPFAGWEMPVWYTGVGQEHSAVRLTWGC